MAGFCWCSRDKRSLSFIQKDGVSKGARIANDDSNWGQSHVIAIDGNFDDSKPMSNTCFNDVALHEKLAANKDAILISQLYEHWSVWCLRLCLLRCAYAQLVKTGQITAGEKVNFTVPTGNFEIPWQLFYAKQIGLPVGRKIDLWVKWKQCLDRLIQCLW